MTKTDGRPPCSEWVLGGMTHGTGGAEHYRSVSIRWPSMDPALYTRASAVLGARALSAAGDSAPDAAFAGTISMNVSDAVRADFDRAQPGRLARAVARAALREATMKGAGAAFDVAGDIATSDDEPKKEKTPKDLPEKNKKGEKSTSDDDDEIGIGWKIAGALIVGLVMFLVSASSEVLDQPDLRAWQLLPDRVTVARMRLPVGDHVVEVTRDGEAFSLGTVSVRPGSVTVLTHRWWPEAHRFVAAEHPSAEPAPKP